VVHDVVKTNKVLNDIPWVLGSKTGFTDQAGGNLVVAFNVGLYRPVVAAVLGSTIDGRFNDIIQLVEATFRYVAIDLPTTKNLP